jgi:hypothetical protein
MTDPPLFVEIIAPTVVNVRISATFNDSTAMVFASTLFNWIFGLCTLAQVLGILMISMHSTPARKQRLNLLGLLMNPTPEQ